MGQQTHEDFTAWIAANRPDYEAVGRYEKSNIKLLMRHKCGYEWIIRPSSFKYGRGCPKCAGNLTKVKTPKMPKAKKPKKAKKFVRPMTKAEFRRAVMHERGMDG